MSEPLVPRVATLEDSAAMAQIYNQGIEDRAATFETAPRTAEDVRAWFDGVHPAVVVEAGGHVVAFAATSAFRTRACYRRNAEFSVYVARGERGRGAGMAAMRALVERCREAGFWKLLSGTFAENAASLGMLGRLGFRQVGTYQKHAQLDGVWKDVTIVERIVAPTVLFVCVDNASLSPVAAAWFNHLVDGSRALAICAGTAPARELGPEVRAIVGEVGLELGPHPPCLLTGPIAQLASRVVTLGPRQQAPVVPGLLQEHWPVADPGDKSPLELRRARDELRERVTRLLAAESWNRPLH